LAPKTVAWIATITSPPPDPDHYFEPLETVARHLGPAVTAVAREHLGEGVFDYDADEVLELTQLLEAKVLPAQFGQKPADRRSIILAGWKHAFAKHKDQPASLATITAARDDQRFLTKALEMSIVLETWEALP
jgi:hypothetical protein